MGGKRKDLTGLKVGRLSILSKKGKRDGGQKEIVWQCLCDCGKQCVVWGSNLRRSIKGLKGGTKSCGCLQRERTAEASLVHGKSRRSMTNSYEHYLHCRSNPQFVIKRHIHHALWTAFKLGKTTSRRWLSKLPYTIDQLKAHIESLFEPWMSWDNYGEWEIDHIIPQARLKYSSTTDENFFKCWDLSNLRPLRAVENRRKGAKIV